MILEDEYVPSDHHVYADAEGLHITQAEGELSGSNMLLDDDSVDIRKGDKAITSFSGRETEAGYQSDISFWSNIEDEDGNIVGQYSSLFRAEVKELDNPKGRCLIRFITNDLMRENADGSDFRMKHGQISLQQNLYDDPRVGDYSLALINSDEVMFGVDTQSITTVLPIQYKQYSYRARKTIAANTTVVQSVDLTALIPSDQFAVDFNITVGSSSTTQISSAALDMDTQKATLLIRNHSSASINADLYFRVTTLPKPICNIELINHEGQPLQW